MENTSKTWATAYTGKTFDNGSLIKESIRNNNPTGMQAFVFNTRKKSLRILGTPGFELCVRFLVLNENLFWCVHPNQQLFFQLELAATDCPKARNWQFSPNKDQLPAKLFVELYQNPVTQGDGNNRAIFEQQSTC